MMAQAGTWTSYSAVSQVYVEVFPVVNTSPKPDVRRVLTNKPDMPEPVHGYRKIELEE